MATGVLFCGVPPCLLLAIAAALLLLLARAEPWQMCGNSGNFEENSPYQTNIKLLSTTLPKNASNNLFANGSAGVVPDIVFALTLCRGDQNASACGSCVAMAFQAAQVLCPFNKEAAIYYDACYLRFSNANFFNSNPEVPDSIYLVNSNNVTSPVRAFDSAVTTLLNATANYAAGNSTSRYGTGEEGFDSSYPIIYGLSQCTAEPVAG